jgi:citrate synthase
MLAHHDAAMRENASTRIFKTAAAGSGDFTQAVCSAFLSIGNLHAPITQARVTLETFTKDSVQSAIKNGYKVAGFGNSFTKGKVDSPFKIFDEYLGESFPLNHKRLYELSGWISEVKHKRIMPNAAGYTATVAILSDCPRGAEASYFMLGRISAYVKMWGAL